MRFSHIGKNPHRRLHDRLQLIHLTRFRYTRFDDSQFGLFVDFPHRKGYSDLRIVTARRTHHRIVFTQKLIKPFFHDRLTITAGNADNRNLKPTSMRRSKSLQRLQCIGNNEKIGFSHFVGMFGNAAYNKIANTFPI